MGSGLHSDPAGRCQSAGSPAYRPPFRPHLASGKVCHQMTSHSYLCKVLILYR